jgi:hypothetical protein
MFIIAISRGIYAMRTTFMRSTMMIWVAAAAAAAF